MKDEVRKRLEQHRILTENKAEMEAKLLAEQQEAERCYAEWRSRAIPDVVEPAWAMAIATLREAGFLVSELQGLQEDQWHLSTSSPFSQKQPRNTTLGLDQKGYYVFRKDTRSDRRYTPRSTTVERLVDFIVDHCTRDLVPFA